MFSTETSSILDGILDGSNQHYAYALIDLQEELPLSYLQIH